MMGKKRHTKRPKTASGQYFSKPPKALTNSVRLHRSASGADPFRDENHPYWHELRRLMKSRAPLKETQILGEIRLSYLYGAGNFDSLYVDGPAVMDMLETLEPTECDTSLLREGLWRMKTDYLHRGTMIHLPGRRSSIFIGSIDWIDGDAVIAMQQNDDISVNPLREDRFSRKLQCNGDQEDDMWRLVANLVLYMTAFPECILDGPPDLIQGSPVGISQHRVLAGEKIERVYSETAKNPHMRRGHWRVLRSERFTHKRWQVVYVRPTMVKGRAETIVDAE